MANYTDWEKLQEAFEKLHKREENMRAELTPLLDEEGNFSNHWEVRGFEKYEPEGFNPLAKRGARYLGLNLSGQEACEGSLNELKTWLQKHESEVVHIYENVFKDPASTLHQLESVTIDQVCLKSAHFCSECAESRKRESSVSTRREMVRGYAKENSHRMKGKNLNRETCIYLDVDRRRTPFLDKWKSEFKVETWEEGYRNRKLRVRINKLFYRDRNLSS